eukprot:CAMPEP_0175145672 /NCGR_PEP_ID=MMETSP0087-20121206/14917_1 /TAXON_ID=136419 /ORGANISM="Unknown Unknown, Strain D1" /LENGTH=187 /DNA_ID=CAMNT_0016430477 /DNA_START=84 /DNA_END=647 /DNA_ORIENTATION=+
MDAAKVAAPSHGFTKSTDPFSSPSTPYKAMCDFEVGGFSGSCTKVFGSSYGHILSHWGLVPEGHPLDLSLAVSGLFLYSLLFLYPLATFVPARESLLLAICSGSVGFSVYLIYVLKFQLNDFCVVCMSFHLCNFVMFFLAVMEFRDKSAQSEKVATQDTQVSPAAPRRSARIASQQGAEFRQRRSAM